MARPSLPHPHLMVLRSVVTVVLSCLIAQAGWAAAFIGGDAQYRAFHQVGAWVTLAACVASALVYLALRRSAGTVNVTLAVLLAALASLQYTLGELEVTSWHVFLGVLTVMVATALTSWTYRHRLPAAGATAGTVSG